MWDDCSNAAPNGGKPLTKIWHRINWTMWQWWGSRWYGGCLTGRSRTRRLDERWENTWNMLIQNVLIVVEVDCRDFSQNGTREGLVIDLSRICFRHKRFRAHRRLVRICFIQRILESLLFVAFHLQLFQFLLEYLAKFLWVHLLRCLQAFPRIRFDYWLLRIIQEWPFHAIAGAGLIAMHVRLPISVNTTKIGFDLIQGFLQRKLSNFD